MIDYDFLTVPAGDADALLAGVELSQVDLTVGAWRRDGLHVTVLRGSKMRTVTDMYEEMAAAFQLPTYFGFNLNALEEFLKWFFWIAEPRIGWVVVILDPESFLAFDETRQEDLLRLAECLFDVKKYWAGTTRYDSTFSPNKPFSLVLVTQAVEGVAAEWTRLGANVRVSNGLPANPATVDW